MAPSLWATTAPKISLRFDNTSWNFSQEKERVFSGKPRVSLNCLKSCQQATCKPLQIASWNLLWVPARRL